jgi:hypothetical protein
VNTINNTEKRYSASVIGIVGIGISDSCLPSVFYSVTISGEIARCNVYLVIGGHGIDYRYLETQSHHYIREGWGEETSCSIVYSVVGEAETTFAETYGDDSGSGCIRKVDYELEQEKITYWNRAHLVKSKGITV